MSEIRSIIVKAYGLSNPSVTLVISKDRKLYDVELSIETHHDGSFETKSVCKDSNYKFEFLASSYERGGDAITVTKEATYGDCITETQIGTIWVSRHMDDVFEADQWIGFETNYEMYDVHIVN